MKFISLSAAIALSLVSTAAFSGSYKAEITASYADLDHDADAIGVMGELFSLLLTQTITR